MNILPTELSGVVVIEPRRFRDERGTFLESWNDAVYAAAGVTGPFVQDNVSVSAQGVLRGLHYQNPSAQGKLVLVASGAIFDVAVDLRAESPTFGRWVGVELTGTNLRQIWVPPGFAHGFAALAPDTVVMYKCTAHYAPQHEHSLRWDDPEIAIDWPIRQPILSTKDAAAPLLKDSGEWLFRAAGTSAIQP